MSNLKKFAAGLSYNPTTGALTWCVKPAQCVKIGAIAGTVKAEGYVRVKWGCDYEYAHRIAWFIMTGEMPRDEIDHRNAIRSDNRWTNIRAATRSLNAQNQRRARIDNKTTGLIGAWPNKSGFMSRIVIGNKRYYLGTFPTAEQANKEYIEAKRRLHEGCTI